jgi:hypothetical protein
MPAAVSAARCCWGGAEARRVVGVVVLDSTARVRSTVIWVVWWCWLGGGQLDESGTAYASRRRLVGVGVVMSSVPL